MFNKIKEFIISVLVGGILFVLPISLFIFLMFSLFNLMGDILIPISKVIDNYLTLPTLFVDIISILILLMICFLSGLLIRTQVGSIATKRIKNVLYKIPGYKVIENIVLNLFNNDFKAFKKISSPCLFKPYGKDIDTWCSGFVVDEAEELYTVFCPTGPNPTSGFIYHVKKECVKKIDVDSEAMLKTILSIGIGSQKIIGNTIEFNEKIK